MEIVLLEDVKALGKKGQVVEAKDRLKEVIRQMLEEGDVS